MGITSPLPRRLKDCVILYHCLHSTKRVLLGVLTVVCLYSNYLLISFIIEPQTIARCTNQLYITNGIQEKQDWLERSKTSVTKQLAEKYIPTIIVPYLNCTRLLENNVAEIELAETIMSTTARTSITNSDYTLMANNCDLFVRKRHYVMHHITEEERDFRIAFSLVMYKDVEQAERLLRAIYRPQNYYCIHVDRSASPMVRSAITAIAACFNNVFLASKQVTVIWGGFSVLESELVCMKDLLQKGSWKYFINLTGQEWPLKTNIELVKILKAYNGSNDVHSSLKWSPLERVKWVYANLTRTTTIKSKPPYGIRPIMGGVHITVTRGFVHYAVSNHKSQQFLEWVKDTQIPDETFFSTLNHNPDILPVPGAYSGVPEIDPVLKPYLSRYKRWVSSPYTWPCFGKWVRSICIFGVRDLSRLKCRQELFANKFHLNYDWPALDCMEEFHFTRTKLEYLGLVLFNDSYYKSLDFVKNHL